MAEAIHRAGASRHSQLIVLVTDLEETAEPRPVLDALRLARMRHTRWPWSRPSPPPSSRRRRHPRANRAQRLRAARRAPTARAEARRGGAGRPGAVGGAERLPARAAAAAGADTRGAERRRGYVAMAMWPRERHGRQTKNLGPKIGVVVVSRVAYSNLAISLPDER